MNERTDSPQEFGSLHSSYVHTEAQLCRCGLLPVQWTEHYCHPADMRGKRGKLCKCQVAELKQTFTVLDGSRDNQPSNGLALSAIF